MNEYLLNVKSAHEYNVVVRAENKKKAIQLARQYDEQLEAHCAIDWYKNVRVKGWRVDTSEEFDVPVSVYGEADLERFKQDEEE